MLAINELNSQQGGRQLTATSEVVKRTGPIIT